MEHSGEAYRGSKEVRSAPVNTRVKVMQPGVTKNDTIPSEVANVESFSDLFVLARDEEVNKVSDLASFVRGSIDVMEVYGEGQLPSA
jgi:hypothetical protein